MDSLRSMEMEATAYQYEQKPVEKRTAPDDHAVQKTPSDHQTAQTPGQAGQPGDDKLRKDIDKINTIMDAMGKKLEFTLDDRLKNQMVVKVVDTESGKVIRQYPPEEMLKIVSRLEDTILGVLVDNKA